MSLLLKAAGTAVVAVAASALAGLSVGQMFQIILALEVAQFPILMSNHSRSRGNARLLDERGGA